MTKKNLKTPSVILQELLKKHRNHHVHVEKCFLKKYGGDCGICEDNDEVLEPYKDQIESYEVFTFPCLVEESLKRVFNTRETVVLTYLVENFETLNKKGKSTVRKALKILSSFSV